MDEDDADDQVPWQMEGGKRSGGRGEKYLSGDTHVA
jgi:hypothetical protein